MARRFPVIVLVGLALVAASGSFTRAKDADERLARLSRVAELYRDGALRLACEETITYRGDATGRITFGYIFVHEDGRIRDYRTWRTGTTSTKRGQEVDPTDYHVPRYLASAYLFAYVFRSDRQPLHAFFNLGDGEALGRKARKIGFQPKGKILKGENDWVGTVWVDRDTSQILRVEAWTPENWNARARREEELAAAASRGRSWESEPYEIEGVEVEFGVEKNGMRFPSKVTMVRTESKVLGGQRDFQTSEHEILRVTQEYSGYEFFSVRTTDEIARFVAGTGTLSRGKD